MPREILLVYPYEGEPFIVDPLDIKLFKMEECNESVAYSLCLKNEKEVS